MIIYIKNIPFIRLGKNLKCPRCGTENEARATYCASCGTSLSNAQSQPSNNAPYSRQPPGFTAGAFPRQHLIPGEVLHWEGKPALIAYLIGPIIITILGLLLLVVTVGIIFIIAGLLGLAVNYIRWTRTSFALTNRRVLTQYGVFSTKFADCAHDKIQNSVVNKPFLQTILGYGEIVFATAGFRGGINSGSREKWMADGGGVYWNGIPHPAELKAYAEHVIESSKQQVKMQDYQMMANVMGQKQTVPNKASIEERLAKAKQLRESNMISQDEYEQMRKNILMEA